MVAISFRFTTDGFNGHIGISLFLPWSDIMVCVRENERLEEMEEDVKKEEGE